MRSPLWKAGLSTLSAMLVSFSVGTAARDARSGPELPLSGDSPPAAAAVIVRHALPTPRAHSRRRTGHENRHSRLRHRRHDARRRIPRSRPRGDDRLARARKPPGLGPGAPRGAHRYSRRDGEIRVGRLLDQLGWDTADMGGVEAARAIEPLCMLWCIPGLRHNQWTHAFKLLKS